MKWVRDNIAQISAAIRDRITIAGHSAGAYIGAMLALDQRYLRDSRRRPGDRPRRGFAVRAV